MQASHKSALANFTNSIHNKRSDAGGIMKKFRIVFLFTMALLVAVPASTFAQLAWLRNPVRDAEKILAYKLSKEQLEIVEYVVALYAVKYGKAKSTDTLKKAVQSLSKDEYDEAVRQAAKAADSKVIQLLFKAGKLGEKGLKTLLVLLDNAAEDIDRFMNEKAQEFDRTH